MDKPKDVDAYIALSLPEAQSTLLELRKIIVDTVPNVEEGISWNVPFYRYHGLFVGFDAFKSHASFGFGNGVITDAERALLVAKGYKLGSGTLQIKYDQNVPVAEIKKILKTKMKINEAAAKQ